MTADRLISIEGISGCGKTYFANQLRSQPDLSHVVFVPELSERKAGTLDFAIISVLRSQGDRFLRLGSPACETFLLMALKTWDYDFLVSPALQASTCVVEDRSVDTIAVYQSLMLHWDDPRPRLETARAILAMATTWRPLPRLTFLIEDEFSASVERAQQREGRQFTGDELTILRGADALYPLLAQSYPDRFVHLDRRSLSGPEILNAIKSHLS